MAVGRHQDKSPEGLGLMRPLVGIVEKHASEWFAGLLAVITLAVYGSSLHFGLIWDDPLYYQRVMAQSSLWQIFTSPQPPTYQFYRPLAVAFAHLVISPAGVVNAPLAHVLQIGAHLIATLAVAPVLLAFGLETGHARLAALCFALSPLAYFGVAWQQNQQPLLLMCLLLSLLAAGQFCRRRRGVWLGLSLLAYAAALLLQEGAAPMVFAFVWLSLTTQRKAFSDYRRWWPLLHIGVVALYAAIWLSMPLHRGVTGQGFQLTVLGYLEQGLVFPFAAALAAATQGAANLPLAVLIGLFVAVWVLLSLGIWKWRSAGAALLSNAWVMVGLLPLWAGLSWDYAQNGPRLFYPATVGIAIVWGGWMLLAFRGRGWRRLLGGLILVGVVGISAIQLWQFKQMYAAGAQQLARAVDVLSAEPPARQRLLFVNFPDRLEMRPQPYPLGFWGVILAPVIQNLSDYAVALRGHSAESDSLAAFVIGADDRGKEPYRVDMRGIDTPPAAFFEAARQFSAVYLTDYLPGGSLRLSEVGAIQPSAAGASPVARLGNAAQLLEAKMLPGGELRLAWRCLQPLQPEDTIFVHFWRGDEFVAGADGDSLGGLAPASTWQPGTDIVDIHSVANVPLEPGAYEVRVGLYNRATGVRYPAFAADGTVLSDGEVPVGTFRR